MEFLKLNNNSKIKNFNKHLDHTHIKDHITTATGLLITFTPISAFIELFISNMTILTSIESRIKIAIMTFGGIGMLFALFRNIFKHISKTTNHSSIKKQLLIDSTATFIFNFLLGLPLYLTSGANMQQAIIGAFFSGLIGFLTGSITGYILDLFHYLNSDETLSKFSKIDKRLNKEKRKLASLSLILISTILTTTFYSIKYLYF